MALTPTLTVIDRNMTRVEVDGIAYYFSYDTLVAFLVVTPDTRASAKAARRERRFAVHQNEWSVATGKHLNNIDGGSPTAKANRLDADAFARAVAAL